MVVDKFHPEKNNKNIHKHVTQACKMIITIYMNVIFNNSLTASCYKCSKSEEINEVKKLVIIKINL